MPFLHQPPFKSVILSNLCFYLDEYIFVMKKLFRLGWFYHISENYDLNQRCRISVY